MQTETQDPSAIKAALSTLLESSGITDQDKFKNVGITRRGKEIILPEGMTYNTAIDWLERRQEEEETIVSIHHEIPCFPLDGAVALKKALDRIYGFVNLTADRTFFGKVPPKMLSVQIGVDEFMQVPWGKMEPPALEGGYLRAGLSFAGRPKFIIQGEIKRKHEEAIASLSKMTEQIIREESIYKGKAIRINMAYLHREDAEERFDPVEDAPQFMDLKGIKDTDLILRDETRTSLETSLFLRLERTEECKVQNIPLKHGLLLMGKYGTGKTLTAKVTAAKATDNDWTFIYLEDCSDLADALRMAELYAPTVLFAEDIDRATKRGRDTEMDKILNTLDGIDTKDKPIITVLTTNHPDTINPAFLRAGRIDTAVWMKGVDEKSGIEFIKKYMVDEKGEALLAKNQNLKPVGKVLNNLVPAFIAEIINKAKLAAVYREGANIKGKVTADDIIKATAALKDHIAMVEKHGSKDENFMTVKKAVDTLHSHINKESLNSEVSVSDNHVAKKPAAETAA